jgi:hypothetical protein
MKQTFLLVLLVLVFLGVQGGEKKTTEVVTAETLAPPLGLKSITGDAEITLLWHTGNYEGDFNGYAIYRRDSLYSGSTTPQEIPAGFNQVAPFLKNSPCNTVQSRTMSGLQNGKTYYFLVVATNTKNEVSHPSNIINDTPRPETFEFDTTTLHITPNKRGYELSYIPSDTCVIEIYDEDIDSLYNTIDGVGDFILERLNFPGGIDENRLWLAGTNGGGVMDLGYMNDWNDADVAPETGYAKPGYSVYAIPGHVYAIKTGDNHYGKIQLIRVEGEAGWLSLKACYQTQAGNHQYKIKP